MRKLLVSCAMCFVAAVVVSGQRAGGQATAAADPVITIESAKGTVQIRLFQSEAPQSVAHIVALVKRNFYRGQRIHRVENSLVQFGDQASRDVSRRAWWGRAGSGKPIGVAEFNKRTHIRGALSLAHGGDARYADSQLFIMKTAGAPLNGVHVVIGQVTAGMDVVDKLQVTDLLKQVMVTEATPK